MMDFNKKNIVKLFFILIFFCGSQIIYCQAKKPTLMILPSDNWCTQRYFMTEYENQGSMVKVPDYKGAFQEDTELGQVISKVGGLMVDKGFPVKDAEQELKVITQRAAEDNMTTSKMSAASLAESPLDILKKTAKADIIIQIWWKVNKTEKGKVVSYTLEALDSYTSKKIVATTGNSAASNEIVSEILLQAIEEKIDEFTIQLQKHFDDMFTNGREIMLFVKVWDSWEYDLEEEFNGNELIDIIDDWMADNTLNGRYSLSDATENFMRFEQVRIPLFDDRNRAIDARRFAKGLRKLLKGEPFNFEIKLMTRGLGEAVLVLGEK